jgi:hypothetical protein
LALNENTGQVNKLVFGIVSHSNKLQLILPSIDTNPGVSQVDSLYTRGIDDVLLITPKDNCLELYCDHYEQELSGELRKDGSFKFIHYKKRNTKPAVLNVSQIKTDYRAIAQAFKRKSVA